MNNYPLTYRTYDQLISEVQSDMRKYHVEDLIDPQDFIKIARKCNFDLSLKLHQTREKLIDITNKRGKLPNDFYIFNYGLGVGQFNFCQPSIGGTHIVNIPLGPNYNPGPGDPTFCIIPEENNQESTNCCNSCQQLYNNCACIPVSNPEVNCKGESYVVVQKYEFYTKEWTETYPLRLVGRGQQVDSQCLNKSIVSGNTIEIKNGFIETSFKSGKVFISYQGQLVDDDNNLLVPDHELLNEYYEYAIKDRVLENAILNGEIVTQLQIELVKKGLRDSRNNALSFVNTPDFSDLQRMWEINRMAQYHKYFSMFKK